MFGGYLFWLVLSKITSVEIIGTYSALVSLANIFTSIVILGVPLGVQRFLGKSFSEGRQMDSKVSIEASVILVGAAIIACSIVIIVLKDRLHDDFKIENELISLLILLMYSSSMYTL
jgi:O-antigen/teichoic acid export membrane protein